MVATTRSSYLERKKYLAKSHATMKAVDHKVSPYKQAKWPLQRLEKQLDEAKVSGQQRSNYLRSARRQWLMHQRQQACPRPRKRGQFRMMDLPAEIRNRIWELAIFGADDEYFFNALECPKLATASRQVCQEVLPVFFKMNDFHIILQRSRNSTSHGLEMHTHTTAWQEIIRKTCFPGLTYKQFFGQVVKIRHFSFTFLTDAKDLTRPTYAEWRIDLDRTCPHTPPLNENAQAKRSVTRLLRSSMLTKHHRFDPLYSEIRANLVTLQVNRNRIAKQWAASQKILEKCYDGVPAFPFFVSLAQFGPQKLLKFEEVCLEKRVERQGELRACLEFAPGTLLSRYFMRLLDMHLH